MSEIQKLFFFHQAMIAAIFANNSGHRINSQQPETE